MKVNPAAAAVAILLGAGLLALVALVVYQRADAPVPCGTWTYVPGSKSTSSTDKVSLSNIAAVASNDVWAVGSRVDEGKQTEQTLLQHWDGQQWTVVAGPNPSNRRTALRTLAAVASDDVWAGGSYLDTNGTDRTLILHWDGTNWRQIPSPNLSSGDNVITGLAAVSASDVWAVGINYPPDSGAGTLTLHWDGRQWTPVPSVSVPNVNNYLGAVTALGPNDVWAVGSTRQFEANGTTAALAEHWDGQGWQIVPTPYLADNQSLEAVVGLAQNDVWAVGSFHSDSAEGTLIQHWDGQHWQTVAGPSPAERPMLSGVAAVNSKDIWAVGAYVPPNSLTSRGTGSAPTLLHWDGTTWALVANLPVRENSGWYAVAALPAGEVWAVGYAGSAELIGHYRSCAAGKPPSPPPRT
jgi:hypothetical protein